MHASGTNVDICILFSAICAGSQMFPECLWECYGEPRSSNTNDRNRRGWNDCPRVYCKHPSPSLLCVLLQFYTPRWARAARIPTRKGKVCVACAHAAIDKTKISYVTVTSICTQQHSKMDGYSVAKIAYGTNATRMTLNKTVSLWACSCDQAEGRSWIYVQHVNLRAARRFTCCP